MDLFEYTFDDPAKNLACDEVLLDEAESEVRGECLRLWESPCPFVVAGLTQFLGDVVRLDACAADAVPVLRRCSGGGCVLQGPGSLNYALVLDTTARPELRTIRGSYEAILNEIGSALGTLGLQTEFAGVSDLATGGLKVSGNAQKRKRRCILHHGTILYRDLRPGFAKYLNEPPNQPQYRNQRTHAQFVTWLNATPDQLRLAVANAWDATHEVLAPATLAAIEALAASRYADSGWTDRIPPRHPSRPVVVNDLPS